MTDDTHPESAASPPPKVGPGRLLRQARLDLRLAPEDVAQMLHLSSKQINALEKDDYEALPGPTYVRGYLRSYAQLLGLAPEKIIDTYNQLTIPPPPIALPQSAPPPQITSKDSPVKAATIGLVLVIAGLVYLWWQSHSPDVSLQLSERYTAQSVVEPAPPVAAPPPARPDEAAAPRPGASVEQLGPAETSKPSGDRTMAAGPASSAEPKEESKPAPPPEPVAERERTKRTRQVVAEVPPGTPRSRMVLYAIQESWADIRDARDTKLVYENVPAGRRISIEGVAPFSVFLGNADGVRVEFNGQTYDVSRHKRGQVARFTLGDGSTVNN